MSAEFGQGVDATYSSKESQDVFDKVSLVVVKLVLPVVEIRSKIDLLGSPERSLSLLVHLPDLKPSATSDATSEQKSTHLSVLDGEEDESAVGLLQERLILLLTLDITYKAQTVLFDGLNLDLLDDGFGGLSLGSGCLELGEDIG